MRVDDSQQDVRMDEGRWEELTRGDELVEQIAKHAKIWNKSSEVPERGWKPAAAPIGKPCFWTL